MPRTAVIVGFFVLFGLASAGCNPAGGGDTDTGDYDDRGEELFRTPHESGNSYSCSSCHAVEAPAEDGYRKPGHPLADATARPNYKNGEVDEMLTAVNSCLDEWMTADTWEPSDADWKALRDWLARYAPDGEADALSYEIVDPPTDFSGGDPEKGREIFNNSCAGCHGEDGVGTTRAIPLDGRSLDPAYVAERVRKSGLTDSAVYDGLTGGRMPFWAKDRLSDGELIDIAAYLAEGGSGGDAGMPDAGGMDAGMTGGDAGGGNCDETHEKVGWTAELETKQHNVGGTARIVDDCTVVIENFTYDGRGINVRLYGAATHGEYTEGYPMTEDLVRDSAYTGERLVATLPDDKTLDDLGGVSVWCVDVGVDFGSAEFTAP